GLLYDKDVPNVGNYTAPLRFAAECGVPAAVLGVGTQGIRTEIGRAAYRDALPLAALATVRDVTDAEILDRECGLAGIQVTADLAFTLPELDPAWQSQRRTSGAKPIALLSVGKRLDLVSGKEGYALQTTIALVEALQGTHEVILAQHSADDEEICAGAEAATGARRLKLAELGVRATLDVYASADLAVTSRYHGVVFAALAGIPVAPVCSREDKIGRLITHALPSLDCAASEVSEGTAPPLVAEEIVRRAVPAARDEVDAVRAAAARNIGLLAAAIRDPSAALRPNARPREAALGRSAICGWVPPERVAAPSQPRPGKLPSSSQASPSDRSPPQGQTAEQSPQPRQKRQRSQADPLPSVVRDLCGEGVFLDVGLPTTGADASQPVQPCVGHIPVVSLDLHPQDDGMAGRIALSINGSASADLEPLPSGAHPLDAATDWMRSNGLPPVSLVRLVDPDPTLLLRAIKRFSGATILVDGWDAMCPTEEDVKTLSVHLALEDIGLFELRGEELLPVPIFSVGECGSSIVVARPLAQMASPRMSEQ
ncbi:polysaccharide pyruvyl transferase family protein, partial [Sphaerobacter sp.]|uniref:polysaccharide pyruvyl transferase family protein n=1 Tax=Sphaerobacter sp. TaxID=2099654 RepID=UPI001E11AFAE